MPSNKRKRQTEPATAVQESQTPKAVFASLKIKTKSEPRHKRARYGVDARIAGGGTRIDNEKTTALFEQQGAERITIQESGLEVACVPNAPSSISNSGDKHASTSLNDTTTSRYNTFIPINDPEGWQRAVDRGEFRALEPQNFTDIAFAVEYDLISLNRIVLGTNTPDIEYVVYDEELQKFWQVPRVRVPFRTVDWVGPRKQLQGSRMPPTAMPIGNPTSKWTGRYRRAQMLTRVEHQMF